MAPPLTDVDIVTVEELLHTAFPKAMKDHYLLYNGGIPLLCCHVYSNGLFDMVNRFLPMKWDPDGAGTLESIYLDLVAKRRLPATLVPFAEDCGANLFCIGPQACVYFYALDAWSSKLSDDENQESAARKIAASFSAFVEGLKPEEDVW